jgi:hypothetical protein
MPLLFRIHLLGGAALDLVYGISRFSEDIDMMCSVEESEAVDHPDFQRALATTNDQLQDKGLYITHIFSAASLVHIDNWLEHLVVPPASAPTFVNFQYDALSPQDIILSKLTRFDEKDRLDIRELMACRNLTKPAISAWIDQAIVPDPWQELWIKGLKAWEAWQL